MQIPQLAPLSVALISRHSALSYEHAGKIEAQLKAEVAELLARAEAADQADVADGMSIPARLAPARPGLPARSAIARSNSTWPYPRISPPA